MGVLLALEGEDVSVESSVRGAGLVDWEGVGSDVEVVAVLRVDEG